MNRHFVHCWKVFIVFVHFSKETTEKLFSLVNEKLFTDVEDYYSLIDTFYNTHQYQAIRNNTFSYEKNVLEKWINELRCVKNTSIHEKHFSFWSIIFRISL